jgi:Domain of unknown function (DUF4276)
MSRGYLVVEGHGELRAALNLVTRLWRDLNLDLQFHWSDPPIRGQALQTREGVVRACHLVRTKRDAGALLVLRDADDDIDCPKTCGPQTADWIRAERLPFPTAVVLFRREFETLFLPCIDRMTGRPLRDDRGIERAGLNPGTVFTGQYESVRGVKEWLSRHFPPGRSYKPTLDQLPLTRMIDFGDLRQSGLPSFGTLENALRFINTTRGGSEVYPSPQTIGEAESPPKPGRPPRRSIRRREGKE